MKAGRELDALVYEKVLGHRVRWSGPVGTGVPRDPDKDDGGNCPCCGYDGHWSDSELLYYSEDIMAAWEVVEHLRSQGKDIRIDCLTHDYDVWIHNSPVYGDGPDVTADTAPMAICLAALKTVGVDIED